MPHNYILGRELSRHFVENRLEENYIGHSNTNNIVGMKRKDSWLDKEAGNFEMQNEHGGPTCEKRVKISPEGHEEIHVTPNGYVDTPSYAVEQNPSQFCHSMVTHMAMSYRNGDQELLNQAANADHGITDSEKSCDVDMECTVPAENVEDPQQQTHIQDDPCYRSAAEQEPSSRKAHFYVYRCKPQYCVFH